MNIVKTHKLKRKMWKLYLTLLKSIEWLEKMRWGEGVVKGGRNSKLFRSPRWIVKKNEIRLIFDEQVFNPTWNLLISLVSF